MNKSLIYSLALMLFAVGCKKNTLPNNGNNVSPSSDVAVELGVDVQGSGATVSGVASRSLGVIDQFADFGTDTIAMYGINEAFDGTQYWKVADRVIDTLGAKINDKGKIAFSGQKKYYPSSGYLNVYAIYPSGNDYVKMVENADGTPPSAEVSLAPKASNQYDVMLGLVENLTVAQSQRAKVPFNHTLAQLRLKVYRVEADYKVPTITKITRITVRGVSKATLDSVTKMDYTPSQLPADSLEFVMYDSAKGIDITANTSDKAHNVGDTLMVFPGMASVSMVTLTIDGLDTYTTPIPNTWKLNQGKLNTLTLKINPFGVRLEDKWTVNPWANGADVDQGLENNGKMIRVSAPMINELGAVYSGVMPVRADVEIDGDFIHKGIKIESVDGGVFTTAAFNSGSLNDEPLYMTAITLYQDDACKIPIFQGKLYGGKLSSGKRVVIDTLGGGRMKVGSIDGEALKLNISFGGMGNGTVAVPYEVATRLHLQNVERFKGKANTVVLDGTKTNGAVFKQMEDIDLQDINWVPIGQSGGANPFFGQYYGNGKVIKNLKIDVTIQNVGLFGYVQLATKVGTTIDGVVIVNGSVSGKSPIGGVAGYISGEVNVSNCYNGASVVAIAGSSSAGVGGVVGSITTAATVSGLVNQGSVNGTVVGIGGVVGKYNAGTLVDCYNTGTVTGPATGYVGGVVGLDNNGLIIRNCYNRGTINVGNGDKIGAIVGALLGEDTKPATFGNNYFLEGTYTKGVGLNNNKMEAVTNPYTVKTDLELKGMAATLGGNWTEDNTDPSKQINDGYPILMWQKK